MTAATMCYPVVKRKKMNEKCKVCNGVKWLWEDKSVHEEGFGKLVPCECNQEAIDRLKSPEPEIHPFLLKWQDYTD